MRLSQPIVCGKTILIHTKQLFWRIVKKINIKPQIHKCKTFVKLYISRNLQHCEFMGLDFSGCAFNSLISTGTWTSGPNHVLPQLQDWISVTHIICVWHNPLDIRRQNKPFIIVSGWAKLFFFCLYSARSAFKIKINNLISEANILGVN